MNPSVWGPSLWFSLHTITLNYPKNPTYEDKKAYNNFFINLQDVLPCDYCIKHYKEHLKKFPLSENLNNRKDLVLWLINIHNEVNKNLNKPVMKPEIALKKISNRFKSQTMMNNFLGKNNWKNIVITLIATCMLGYILYLIAKKMNIQYSLQNLKNPFKRNINQLGRGYHNVKNSIYYGNRF